MIRTLFNRRRRLLDLDDRSQCSAEIEIDAAKSGNRTSRRMAVRFLHGILRQALVDGALAINLFYDAEDDCLRALQCRRDPASGAVSWFEFLPAPGYFAADVLRELRRRLGMRVGEQEGVLQYTFEGQSRTAVGSNFHDHEVRVYFTSDRPVMRTKWRV